jgi:hypothetical protein
MGVGVGSTPEPPPVPELIEAELEALEDAAFFNMHAEVPSIKKTTPKMTPTFLILLF